MIIITLRLNFHAWHDPAVLGTISLEKSERKMLTDHSSTTCQDHLKAEVVLMPTYQVISVAHCGDRWGLLSWVWLSTVYVVHTRFHLDLRIPQSCIICQKLNCYTEPSATAVWVISSKKKSNIIRMITYILQLCFMDLLDWKCLPKVNYIISLKEHSSLLQINPWLFLKCFRI